jgi:hypothetical protein
MCIGLPLYLDLENSNPLVSLQLYNKEQVNNVHVINPSAERTLDLARKSTSCEAGFPRKGGI